MSRYAFIFLYADNIYDFVMTGLVSLLVDNVSLKVAGIGKLYEVSFLKQRQQSLIIGLFKL